ncbi:hypothetical protein [Streptomyces sp. NPDC053427]|uniref:hypothetical protein n=1 Tax=Streptomyces sp. NPDC053427 TaxID=3365701 RepID=UPI0037D8C323
MHHGGDRRTAEQQRGGRAHDDVPTALTAGRHRAAQLLQRVRRGLQVTDPGVQQSPQLVLAAETAEASPTGFGSAATAPAAAVTAATVRAPTVGAHVLRVSGALAGRDVPAGRGPVAEPGALTGPGRLTGLGLTPRLDPLGALGTVPGNTAAARAAKPP